MKLLYKNNNSNNIMPEDRRGVPTLVGIKLIS